MQHRLKTNLDIRKNPRFSRSFSKSFVVQEIPYINAITIELHLNGFNNNRSSLGNSNNENYMDINFKPPTNVFYLNIYKTAILYLFKFQDPTSFQKRLTIKKKITKNNFETKKSEQDFLIPLETIMQIMDLYKQANLKEDGVTMNVLVDT